MNGSPTSQTQTLGSTHRAPDASPVDVVASGEYRISWIPGASSSAALRHLPRSTGRLCGQPVFLTTTDLAAFSPPGATASFLDPAFFGELTSTNTAAELVGTR